MQIKQFNNAPKFSILQQLAVVIQSGNESQIIAEMKRIKQLPGFSGKAWQANFSKLLQVFETRKNQFSIFALGGNSKLPFVAFSTLPGVTCPGAGECLNFCYSFRAWRYPAAFARMAQNAFLMRFNNQEIYSAFESIAQNRKDGFDFRLYVDGDFSSIDDVDFWMWALSINQNARAYGYSKSFAQLLDFDSKWGNWPGNYQLNISGGHNAGPETIAAIEQLPITRGHFIAVSIGRKVKSTDHGKPETNKALRDAFGAKAFTCPGACGACTKSGHACGMPKLKGLPIIIAMH
jgi:hypothetical protein